MAANELTITDPPEIPALPPGHEFDLTRPTLTTPDGTTFILPAEPPYDSPSDSPSEVVSPDAVEPVGWMVIAKHSGMLYGFLMDKPPDEGQDVPAASQNALVWKVPEKAFYKDEFLRSSKVVTYTYTEDAFAYVRNSFDSESASASFGFASASFERSHAERSAGAQVKKTLHIHACDQYPRVTITLDRCTAVNPDFVNDVQEALRQPTPDQKFHKLNAVFHDYGHAVPRRVLLGGMRSFDQKQTINASTSEHDVKEAYSASFSVKGLGGSGSASATFQTADGQTVSGESIAATARLDYRGGDTTADPAHWPDTVKTPRQWAVIGYTGLRSTIELLPADLQDQVNAIWTKGIGVLGNPLPWKASELQKASGDGLLLGVVTAWTGPSRSCVIASAGTGEDTAAWPQYGMATAAQYNVGRVLPLSSFCLPVRKHDKTFYTMNEGNDIAVNFIPIGTGDRQYLGAPVDLNSVTSTTTIPVSSDGFLIVTMQLAVNGNRGVIGVRQAGGANPSNWLGATSIHYDNTMLSMVGEQSFCIPVQKSLGQLELVLDQMVGQPKVKARFVPLVNAAFGEAEERAFDVVFTADESEGFLVGVLDADDRSRAEIRLQIAAPNAPLADTAGTSIDHNEIFLAFMARGTSIVPVRKGMRYQGLYRMTEVNSPVRKRLYWVPLRA